jgi:hypothetical protein
MTAFVPLSPGAIRSKKKRDRNPFRVFLFFHGVLSFSFMGSMVGGWTAGSTQKKKKGNQGTDPESTDGKGRGRPSG